MNYFDRIKAEKFPEITDFSDAQDKLRNKPGYEHSVADWYWFNPFAFRYIKIGVPSCFVVSCSIIVVTSVFKGWKFFGVVGGVIFLISVVKLVQALMSRKMWKTTRMNFYDLHLREYPLGDGVPKK